MSRRHWSLPGILARGFVGLALLGVWALMGVASAVFWYYERPQPPAVSRVVEPGITYTRHVIEGPLPQVIHVATIDLHHPGISWSITRPLTTEQGRPPLLAQTVEEYAKASGAAVALNGDYFTPWHFHSPFDYYPRSGDPVDVNGFAIWGGQLYASTVEERPILVQMHTGETVISSEIPAGSLLAISGYPWLVIDDQPLQEADAPTYWLDRNPRSALGLSEDGRFLYLVANDGRQPGYSAGLTLPELAAFLHELGAYRAFNLDGGGSTALVMGGWFGPHAVNSPVHSYIPGWQRPVANHLGVFVE
ncbi:MAG: phosphodiester glycosidase family protein [Verrucomicrobiota bacterium JB022]|nr:phosphodiester glycosidase family protein [Verrucomicrobiota bacterium JB022]